VLDGIVGHFEPSVVDVVRQRRPARCGVADGAGKAALPADLRHRLVEEGGQFGEGPFSPYYTTISPDSVGDVTV
jgi:hypothetical protein